jgi:hypothetical protein
MRLSILLEGIGKCVDVGLKLFVRRVDLLLQEDCSSSSSTFFLIMVTLSRLVGRRESRRDVSHCQLVLVSFVS